jgi:hypothetical protein
MVCSPPRTPLLALNIVVGVTALALATVLATYETDYYYRSYSPYGRLPAIVMAYTTTALSVAYYTGRLIATIPCCSRIINCCSAAHATGPGLAGDVVMGMAVLSAAMLAVLYPTLEPKNTFYGPIITSAQKNAGATSYNRLYDDKCGMYHALQALLWCSVSHP